MYKRYIIISAYITKYSIHIVRLYDVDHFLAFSFFWKLNRCTQKSITGLWSSGLYDLYILIKRDTLYIHKSVLRAAHIYLPLCNMHYVTA